MSNNIPTSAESGTGSMHKVHKHKRIKTNSLVVLLVTLSFLGIVGSDAVAFAHHHDRTGVALAHHLGRAALTPVHHPDRAMAHHANRATLAVGHHQDRLSHHTNRSVNA